MKKLLPLCISLVFANSFANTIGVIEQYQKDRLIKVSGVEEKASKTFICLLAGTFIDECKSLRKDFAKMVANPKKYGNPATFLGKSVVLSGKGEQYTKEMTQKQIKELYGTNMDTSTQDAIMESQAKRAQSFTKSLDYDYHWNNRHPKFIGMDSEGNLAKYYSCDVSENGLNSKIETKVERYRDGHQWKERYYLRTLTVMPKNCNSLKYHYPIISLPKYDAKKCNGQWYKPEDYFNGYYTRSDGLKLEQVKIEKNCWYEDSAEKAKLEEDYQKALSAIYLKGIKEGKSHDQINVEMNNYGLPEQFKVHLSTKTKPTASTSKGLKIATNASATVGQSPQNQSKGGLGEASQLSINDKGQRDVGYGYGKNPNAVKPKQVGWGDGTQ